MLFHLGRNKYSVFHLFNRLPKQHGKMFQPCRLQGHSLKASIYAQSTKTWRYITSGFTIFFSLYLVRQSFYLCIPLQPRVLIHLSCQPLEHGYCISQVKWYNLILDDSVLIHINIFIAVCLWARSAWRTPQFRSYILSLALLCD